MDIKVTGITREVMSRALEQARQARLYILERMNEAIAVPRATISQYAPRIISIFINKDKIRDVIGPGGKMIRSITERTGCKIEINDDGRVDIASVDEQAAQKAVEIIKELTAEAELGKTYVGKVVRVVNFGAFVEILPGVEGLLHISEIDERRIGEVRDVLDEGDEVMVKVIDIDAQGRVRLSRRAVLREQSGAPAGEPDSDEAVGVGAERPRGRRPHNGPHGPGRGGGGGGSRGGGPRRGGPPRAGGGAAGGDRGRDGGRGGGDRQD
jgi:polyribonucleotide nucleotidyltransferase